MAPYGDPDLSSEDRTDGDLFVDALLTILAGLAMIVMVVLRHPVRLAYLLVIVTTIGAIAGWWVL